MSKKNNLLFLIILLIIGTLFCKSNINPPSTFQTAKHDYLITFANKEDIKKISKKYNISIIKEYTFFPIILASLTKEQVKYLQKEESIIGIEKDGSLGKSEITKQSIQSSSSEIFRRLQITNNIQSKYTGKGVKIAILDSGIDISHPDLSVKGGISFVGNTKDLSDSTGHGTHVAGIISAKANDIGITGVAPNAYIYAVKILNNRDFGKNSILLSAIDWCLKNKMDIIHMSISSNKKSKAVEKALQEAYNKGALMIASAGNRGFYLKESITYPGAYESVIAVGSLDNNNKRSIFSSVGKELEIMAPGEKIYSTEPNGYGYRDGTSMAAPYVTGIAALIMEKYPGMKNIEIRNRINESATKLGDPFLYGNGIINAKKALRE
jgi:subtilisin